MGLDIRDVALTPIQVSRRNGSLYAHVIVSLRSDDLTGYGEMSDLSHFPRYHIDLSDLERTLRSSLVGVDLDNSASKSRLWRDLEVSFPDEHHQYSKSGMIRTGVDLAVHDLLGKAYAKPAGALFGTTRRSAIQVAYPIFRHRSIDDVQDSLEEVDHARELGFRHVRLYVGADPEADETFLQRLRDEHSDITVKSLDFSNLLGPDDALALMSRLEPYGYELVESPSGVWDLAGLARVRRLGGHPVSEHVYSRAHLRAMCAADAIDVANIGPYLLGGLRGSYQLAEEALAKGVGVLIGTTQELALGTSACAHVGSLLERLDSPSDPVGPLLYTDDVAGAPQYVDGFLQVPSGPGLGIDVDDVALRRLRHPLDWSGKTIEAVIDRRPRNDR